LEGGEGAGKSTQVQRLAERLKGEGLEVVTTREPGGSPGAESIRALFVTGAADRWSPVSETLLVYAARRDHIERVISPALNRGAWVVCDRFADSTRAYQADAPPALLESLEALVLEGVRPDLTLVLDLPVDVGFARVAGRTHDETRFETKGRAFHERLRQAFLTIAQKDQVRCAVVDASRSVDEVERAIWSEVQARLVPA
jgi:dTMP kinase